MTFVAFLRGINVGGKNKVSMTDLAAIFRDSGCRNVRTYIQSGNVLFEAPLISATFGRLLAEQIHQRLAVNSPVVIRSSEQLTEVARSNPFIGRGREEDSLHVLFLADEPTPALVNQLDPARSFPDEFVVQGREIYLHLPNGVARSKLTNAYFDVKLKTICTGRNWRTVVKLAALANG